MSDTNPPIRPMSDDILLSFRSTKEERRNSVLWTPEKKNPSHEYYNVEAVGSNITDVTPGDVVVCQWANMTEPFEFDGKKYAVTDIKQIMAIIED